MCPLYSARLVLCPHTEASLSQLHLWKNDRQIQAMSADTFSTSTRDQTQQTLARWMRTDRQDIIHLAIHLRSADALIGFLHIALIDPSHQRCHIGIVIGEKALWGNGYGTEALERACRYCFTQLDINRIGAETYATNPGSARMLEKVGFIREGILREHIWRDGQPVDEHVYGLLRRDWEQGLAARST